MSQSTGITVSMKDESTVLCTVTAKNKFGYVKSEYTYNTDGLLHGPFREYYDSYFGNEPEIKREGTYLDGELDGEYTEYYEDNSSHYAGIKKKATYRKGQLHGKYAEYNAPMPYVPGYPIVEENYSDGLLHGRRVVYDKFPIKGKIKIDENYHLGKLHGTRLVYANSWYSNDAYLLGDEEYKDGVLHGECRFYVTPLNTPFTYCLAEVRNFHEGVRHGSFRKYKLGKKDWSRKEHDFKGRPEIRSDIGTYLIFEIDKRDTFHNGERVPKESSNV